MKAVTGTARPVQYQSDYDMLPRCATYCVFTSTSNLSADNDTSVCIIKLLIYWYLFSHLMQSSFILSSSPIISINLMPSHLDRTEQEKFPRPGFSISPKISSQVVQTSICKGVPPMVIYEATKPQSYTFRTADRAKRKVDKQEISEKETRSDRQRRSLKNKLEKEVLKKTALESAGVQHRQHRFHFPNISLNAHEQTHYVPL